MGRACDLAVLLLMGVPLVGLTSLALSSPITGQRASLEKDRIEAMAERTIVERFRGGERACVIVRGDHKPVVDLYVHVFDDKDRLVTKDEAGGDLVAVIWYPPRDGTYKIKIKNTGVEYNECYISFK